MKTTFRIEKSKNYNDYTVIPNHHLKNHNLSLKAKGLQTLLLSLPEDWDFTVEHLAALSKDNNDAVNSGLHELEAEGYLVRERKRNEKGQLTDMEYIIYQLPIKGTKKRKYYIEKQTSD